jgi:hypothetical protein
MLALSKTTDLNWLVQGGPSSSLRVPCSSKWNGLTMTETPSPVNMDSVSKTDIAVVGGYHCH